MKSYFILLLTLVSTIALADCRNSDSMCGPTCVRIACQKLGVTAELEDLCTLSGWTEENGTTMLGLLKAVKAKGLQAVGMKMTLDEVVAFRGPAILRLWGDHFVVVEAGDAVTMKVTTSPGEPQPVRKEDFKKLYSGFALLIAKDASTFPAPKAEGPDLRFDSYSWDFGSLMQGDQKEYSFKCRNVGNADLAISKIETSCSDCLSPTTGPQTIPPGRQGEIRALLLTGNQRRRVAKKLYVTSNDPISPTMQLEVVGYVKPAQLVTSPSILYFGKVRRTETVSREIYIAMTVEDDAEVNSVTSGSAYVTAALSRSTDKNRPGYIATVTMKPGAPIGEFTGKITVNSTHPKQPKVELPVTATIRGNIDLSRESFFLGVVRKGQTRSTSVAVSTVGKDPLRITKIDNPLDHLTVDVVPKVDGKEYVLTATLKADTPVGNVNGDMVVHTNDPDQPEIKIPVFAYVEE